MSTHDDSYDDYNHGPPEARRSRHQAMLSAAVSPAVLGRAAVYAPAKTNDTKSLDEMIRCLPALRARLLASAGQRKASAPVRTSDTKSLNEMFRSLPALRARLLATVSTAQGAHEPCGTVCP